MLRILTSAAKSFINDSMLSRGAAVAFYTLASLAPLLTSIVALAGLVMDSDAARHALQNEFTQLVGPGSSDLFGRILQNQGHGQTWLGIGVLILAASGAFGEIQAGLNQIWTTPEPDTTVSKLVKARAISLGLVGLTAFLLLVSLAVSAGLTALGGQLNVILPFGDLLLHLVDWGLSYALLALLFAAVYKLLPDTPLSWRDVLMGAAVTAFLFVIGKALIGFYLGTMNLDVYGEMSAPIIVALWIYYSTQIFFFGAEITKSYAHHRGSRQDLPTEEAHYVPAPHPWTRRFLMLGGVVAGALFFLNRNLLRQAVAKIVFFRAPRGKRT